MPALSLIALSGCIDSDYDLSDINTESEIRVNNLVLPVNIDQLTLDDVISIDEDSKIKVVDGKYAVLVEGDFHSDPIEIGSVSADAPAMDECLTPLSPRRQARGRRAAGVAFDVPSFSSTFSYSDHNVDSAIKSIDEVDMKDFFIELNFYIPALNGYAGSMTLSDIVLEMPKGLITDDKRYDKATGLFRVPELKGDYHGTRLRLPVAGIEMKASGAVFDRQRGTFDFHGEIKLVSASLTAEGAGSVSQLPSDIVLHTAYNLPALDVEYVTGNIEYDVEEFNIDPINLDDLPDFLAQKETNLIIGNPQIYISINNPLGTNGAEASTGLTLESYRDGSAPKEFHLDNGTFSISDNQGNGPYNFCLSPKQPEKYYQGFENASHEPFTSLSNVLAGEGLPTKIEVIASDPRFYGNPVRKLPLGRKIDPIDGKYVFYAPLALEVGSNIVYTDKSDGWSSEDLDAVTIEMLEVTAEVTSDIDQTVKISGYPIDVNGNAIDGVEIVGAEIPANASNYKITIRTTGEVRYLDGFVYTATAASAGAEPLSPDQHIILKNVRAKVSGKYVKEL